MEKIRTREDILKLLIYIKELDAYVLRLEGSWVIEASIFKDKNISDDTIFIFFREAIDGVERAMKSKIKETRRAIQLDTNQDTLRR